MGKSECRNPKSERNPKETNEQPSPTRAFGFRSSGFLRISGFGFRAFAALLCKRHFGLRLNPVAGWVNQRGRDEDEQPLPLHPRGLLPEERADQQPITQ